MEEKESQARALLDKTNRQFNECNALYHAAAQRCGLSDAAFWTLYALVTSCEPLTQNRIAADWGIPKQTLNSAVAAMVKRGLLALCPGKAAPGGRIGPLIWRCMRVVMAGEGAGESVMRGGFVLIFCRVGGGFARPAA